MSMNELQNGLGSPRPQNYLKFASSGPVVAMVWQGENAIKIGRKIIGSTYDIDRQPGQIRADNSMISSYNIIHGSDSIEAAKNEIELWF